jgi:hypothetical protein
MQSFDPLNLPFDKLDNPGWDPICFASPRAFLYLLSGLTELVLEYTDSYITQYLFHLEDTERIGMLDSTQARVLIQVLNYIWVAKKEVIENNSATEELKRIQRMLEEVVSSSTGTSFSEKEI